MKTSTDSLAKEKAAYEANLPTLVKEYGLGKHALFIGAVFIGAFASYRDALVRGYTEMKNGHFLVRKISLGETAHIASPVERVA